MGLKDILFRLKVFFWYLGTEPFRQLKELARMVIHVLEMLNKTRTWTYFAVIGMTVALFYGKKFYAGLFLVFLLFVIFVWEWERGTFMHRYREKIKKNIEKEVQKNERNK
jgi:hypothetical protein